MNGLAVYDEKLKPKAPARLPDLLSPEGPAIVPLIRYS